MGEKSETKKFIKKTVVFIGKVNIHSQLIRRELEQSNKFIVKQINIDEFSHNNIISTASVVLMSYQCSNELSYCELFPSSSFSSNLVVYNIPPELKNRYLASWYNLKGVLYENASLDHLTRCVEVVANGDFWLPRHLMARMLEKMRPYALSSQSDIEDLTKREKQILDRLVCGRSNLQIANELFIAESTVKTHVYKLYKKLNVSCRREAINLARKKCQPAAVQYSKVTTFSNLTPLKREWH